MQELGFPTTAGLLGQVLGASVLGEPEQEIQGLASLGQCKAGSLSFFSDRKYTKFLEQVKGGVVLTAPELVQPDLPVTYLLVNRPKEIFAEIARQFRPRCPWEGIDPRAIVHPKAKLEKGVVVGPGAVVSENASIGAGTIIFPQAYVGPGVQIGKNSEIHPFVSLVTNVKIGNRVKIFSGSVIGSEGFGFLQGDSGYTDMPQIGWVVIEDDVRIGAQCTVDRGTLGETRVGAGTKLDDHVHVGHNCIIGKNCILCGQVALAGSATLEDGVVMGGQVGVAGHLTIGAGAKIGAQTGVGTDLKSGETYFMTPAVPMREALRSIKYWRQLPEIVDRIRKLEIQNIKTPEENQT